MAHVRSIVGADSINLLVRTPHLDPDLLVRTPHLDFREPAYSSEPHISAWLARQSPIFPSWSTRWGLLFRHDLLVRAPYFGFRNV